MPSEKCGTVFEPMAVVEFNISERRVIDWSSGDVSGSATYRDKQTTDQEPSPIES